MKRYYIHVNGWAHAMTAYGVSESDARARFREQHGLTRLPRGTTVWEG